MDFIFLGSKITVDGDFSHKIKRLLLFGRKAMWNLDSILKSIDITLPTRVHIAKAIVFPVVTYGYDSWAIKKPEYQRIDTFKFWCWRRLLSPLNCKEIKPVDPKENNPEYSFIQQQSLLKLHYFGPLMCRANSLQKTLMMGKIEGNWRRGQQRMGWLDSIIDSMDMNLSKLA